MYLIKPPLLYRWFLNRALFRTKDNKVHLTFDDGPDPDVTPPVLDILNEHDISATFFVLGKNAEKYPDILDRIKREGHTLGNHGYDHLDGWRITTPEFVSNQKKGAAITGSELFRPPYGRAWPWQLSQLTDTRTVMWDVLSGDFDKDLSQDQVVDNVVSNAKGGSIILMHDSAKTKHHVLSALPPIIRGIRDSQLEFGRSLY